MMESDAHGAPPAAGRALAAGRAAFGSGWQPAIEAVAPGRIELLGNHLDYNGGPVLAAAIDRFVVVYADDMAGSRRTIEVLAADISDEHAGRALLDPGALRDWHNRSPPPQPLDYVRGAIAGVLGRGTLELRVPARIAIAGDVPIGFGVSSSAALCVSLSLALTRHPPAGKELVLLAQEAEHRAGTPCGTMDQSTSVAGGVIRFDGATLEVERLSPHLRDLVFAVADSGVTRSLGASSYPTRVKEAKEALAIARAALIVDLPHLAALTAEQLQDLIERNKLPDPLLARVRHVVSETARVEQGVTALRHGDWTSFGALMTRSGRSSATDYAISHPRVEELVTEMLTIDGVLGARMMGGGEGGTALVLLARDRVDELNVSLRRGYYDRYHMADRDDLIHVCAFANGARVGPPAQQAGDSTSSSGAAPEVDEAS